MKKVLVLSICMLIFSITLLSQSQIIQQERSGIPGIPALNNQKKSTQGTADILISSLNENLNPEDMVQSILGAGISIYNVNYTGSFGASGIFSNGKSTGIDFENGIILSSGWANSILGPNNVASTSNNNDLSGDVDLSAIIANYTYDASILEFDFVPKTEVLTFNYILFSEEYPEYLQYSDVFAFILDGVNIALIPGTTKPVAIGTINHLTNNEYYVSNEYGIYNVQADGFTTSLTASAQVTKNVPHHIKLAIADMGDHVYDSWVLIEGKSFSSLGTIAGIVYDSETLQPLKDVQISASGYNVAQTPTNENGEYIILNLKFGYGYELTAFAPGYQKKIISGIHLLSDNPLVIQNIYLEPIAGDFVIESMKPDPNPELSTAMPNSKMVHRYYCIKNQDNNTPAFGIPVYVRQDAKVLTYYSNEFGIVDIALSEATLPDNVGDEMSFEIFKVLNKELEQPILFNVKITDSKYEKYWAESNNINGSFSNIVGGLSSNSSTKIFESDNSNVIPEQLAITLGDNAFLGAELFPVGAEAIIKVNDFSVGASATANGQADAKIYSERGFQFNYLTQEEKEALAKYYLYSKANFGLLDNSLIRLGSVVEDIFINNFLLDDYFQYDKSGLMLTGSGSANANIGIIPILFNLSAGAEVSASVSSHSGTIVDKDALESHYYGLETEFDGSASTNMMVMLPNSQFTKNLEEELSFFDNEFNINIRRGISLSMSENKIELSYVKRNVLQTGWESTHKYIITGNDVLYYFSSIDLIGSIVERYEGKEIVNVLIENATWSSMTIELFKVLYALDKEILSGKLMINYESYRSDFTEDEPLDLYIGLGLEAWLKISASLGGGTTIEEGRSKLIERGKWINFKHLPLEEYNTFIPDLLVEHDEIIQQIIDDIPLHVRILIGAYQVLDLISPLKSYMSEIKYNIGNGGSYLLINPSVVPDEIDSIYCVSWGWYGDVNTKKSAGLKSSSREIFQRTKKSAQELYKLAYGLGGFYQFEPNNLDLNGQSTLVIKYSDEELEGVDESKLALYYEDKENHKWIYVGGTVNTETNELMASISKLALYTLAPAIPDGEIILHTANDTIPADGITTTIITSDPIYYNNSSVVDDDEIFTVKVTNGSILNTDMDPELEGIQINAISGILQVELLSSHFGIISKISISSVSGYAEGEAGVFFKDEIKPQIPVLQMAEGYNNSILLKWTNIPDQDLAGYKIYFDSDSDIPPYSGLAKINGSPSPITIVKNTSYIVTDLFEDSTYFISVTAFDISNNESDYSNVLTTGMSINHLPEIEDQEFIINEICNHETVLGKIIAQDQDGDKLSYSIVSGKNANLFNVDTESGLIYLSTGTGIYEATQQLLIRVNDDGPGELSSNAIITLKTNCLLNHSPQLEDASFELTDTNMVYNHWVGQIQAIDQDAGQMLTYEIPMQVNSGAISIDSKTGDLFISDLDALVFDEYGEFKVKVVTIDNGEGWLSDTAFVSINLLYTSNQTHQNDLHFIIYPNPIKEKVYISPKYLSSEPVSIELYSVLGKLLYESKYPKGLPGKAEINMEKFETGIYLIKIHQLKDIIVAYVVKE